MQAWSRVTLLALLPGTGHNGSMESSDAHHAPNRETADTETAELARRIEDFVRTSCAGGDDRDNESFSQLAQSGFAYQYRRIEPFRRLCDHRGTTPETLIPFHWTDVPAVPVMAFRGQALHAAPAREIFRSSGTTGGEAQRSVHYHPLPDLYRAVIECTFPSACFPGTEEKRPMLSLVPSRKVVPDSSLGFMCEHVLDRFGAPPTTVAMDEKGLRVELANRWCRELQGAGTILTTAFALAFWLDALEEQDLAFSLPEGSTLFETGGFKGRTREIERQTLLRRIRHRLGIEPSAVVREYGMTELTGHFYTHVLHGGDPDRFHIPPFMRVHMLDPESLEPVPLGQPGLLTFFDLSNVGSAIHVITQDLGVYESELEFRLLGRADEAQLRGCSLTAEELSSPDML